MAIGTAAAIGIGLLGAGSVASAVSGNNAARRAADVSQQNTASNTALARDIYQQNRNALTPWQSGGMAAFNQRNALLGLSQTPTQAPQAQPNALAQFGANQAAAGDQMGFMGRTNGAGLPYGIGDNFITTGTFDNGAFDADRQSELQTPGFTAQPVSQSNPQADAFQQFRDSTGYQFRLGEGMDALNSGYAGAGVLQSGAAMRGALEYGQNFASNEFANYMGMLGQQQGVGLQAAGAQAGVGLDYSNQVIGANNANAANQMNAQLARQNVFGNALGTVGGGLFGYGIGG